MGPINRIIFRPETCISIKVRSSSLSVTMARGPVFASKVSLYSLAYHAIDVMDNDNLALTSPLQIQVSIALIGMVRKQSEVPIVLVKQWGTTLQKLTRLTSHNTEI